MSLETLQTQMNILRARVKKLEDNAQAKDGLVDELVEAVDIWRKWGIKDFSDISNRLKSAADKLKALEDV